MAYLLKHPDNNKKINDASYLVIPEIIDGFSIGDFLQNMFKQFIEHKFPIGLITFSENDASKVRLKVNISNRLKSDYQITYENFIKDGMSTSDARDKAIKRNFKDAKSGAITYWAAWRENYPHDTYFLLKTALKNQTKGVSRVEEIWKEFYYSYYCYPPNARSTLKSLNNKLFSWDKKSGKFIKQKWLQDVKKDLRESVKSGEDSFQDAISRIKWASSSSVKERKKYWKDTQKLNVRKPSETPEGLPSQDNDYTNIKKNRRNGMKHTGLWDNNTWEVTNLGKSYVKLFQSKDPIEALATIYIGGGKWDELVKDILSFQDDRSKNIPDSVSEHRENLKEYFINQNLIGLNPGRRAGKKKERPFLASELQTLGHFKIYEGFEKSKRGFVFNLNRLNELKKNYNNFLDLKSRLTNLVSEIQGYPEEELIEIESKIIDLEKYFETL